MKNEPAVPRLCQELEASASGYYDWQSRCSCPGPRALQDQALKQQIQCIHTARRKTYGSPCVVMELRKSGACHGRNRVARLKKQEGPYGRQKARYRVDTPDSIHDQPVVPNRLAEAPKAIAPNQLWVADDIRKAYLPGVSSYHIKPGSFGTPSLATGPARLLEEVPNP